MCIRDSIYTNLGEFLDKFPEEEQEETEVTKKEIEDTVAAAVAKALETQQKPATDPVQKAAEPAAEPAGLTVEAGGKRVETAVAKALGCLLYTSQDGGGAGGNHAFPRR